MSLPSKKPRALQVLTRQFVDGTLDVKAFGHLEHVKVAHDLLLTCDFFDAAILYVSQIRQLAKNAGAPEKFNLTITLAYLSLIAERMESNSPLSFDDFLSRNTELMSKHVLQPWYSQARLNSPRAREQFLLPEVTANRLSGHQ